MAWRSNEKAWAGWGSEEGAARAVGSSELHAAAGLAEPMNPAASTRNQREGRGHSPLTSLPGATCNKTCSESAHLLFIVLTVPWAASHFHSSGLRVGLEAPHGGRAAGRGEPTLPAKCREPQCPFPAPADPPSWYSPFLSTIPTFCGGLLWS